MIKHASNLNPGRELDALVAERVMGWRRLSYQQAFPDSDFQRGRTKLTSYWHDPSGAKKALAEDSYDYYQPEDAWSPSTDIAAAWTIIDKMIADGWEVGEAGYSRSQRKWDFTFNGGIAFPGPLCDSAPHAICLAALKALGINV